MSVVAAREEGRREAAATLYSHDFLICPWCGEPSGCRVDHLYEEAPQEAGPWYCGKCRCGISIFIRAPREVEVKRSLLANWFSRSMVLLKFEGKDHAVWFVMDHDRYHDGSDEGDEENQAHQRYFFEEHSCPTNWLCECVAVIKNGDCDPHGFLSFVRAVDVPLDFDEDLDENWFRLFPEAFDTGPVIDADPVRLMTGGIKNA